MPGSWTGTGTGTITYGITYQFLKQKGSNVLAASTNILTEGYKFPLNPRNGDLFTNIGVVPYQGYQYSNISGWLSYNFTKLGETSITSGSISTPISYAYNARYISPITDVVGGSSRLALYHNIGTNLTRQRWVLLCTTYDSNTGYLAGDEIDVESVSTYSNSYTPYFTTQSTKLSGALSSDNSGLFEITPRSGGAPVAPTDNNNFSLMLFAERYF